MPLLNLYTQLTFVLKDNIINCESGDDSDMEKFKKDKIVIYVLCLILALIIAFGVGIFLSMNNNRTKDGQASQKTTDTQLSNTSESAQTTTKTTNKFNEAPIPGTIDNPTIITIDEELWHLTLVNSYYRIPDTYKPDLVAVCGSEERLDRKIALEYEKMYAAALNEGVYLTPCSGYRSYELQERNYNNKIKFFENQGYSTEDAKVKAATIIMPPGSSEHNLGYAMDIVCVEEWFENTDEFRWLTENAADYGFIMRYPKDKQDITGVIYEPWHWRYVGVEAAKEMKEKNLTLEEYLGVY